jgi:exonuclease SbcC
VRLHALRLQHFRQHADTAVTFDAGLTGIIGPNGAGKSTLLEAIAWALYGNEAARGKRDSIRSLRAPKGAAVRVELDCTLGGHRLRIVRGLTSAELYLDGAAQPVANSISTVGEFVQRRLAMTRAEFFHTYFTGQKELDAMAAMGPTERGQFLSRVLGYERLREAQDLARERRRDLAHEIAGLRQALPDPDALREEVAAAARAATTALQHASAAAVARDAAADAVAALAPRWAAAQAQRDARATREAEQRVAEADLLAARRARERADLEVADVAEARRALDALAPTLAALPPLVAERERLDALARDDGRRRSLSAQVAEYDETLARLGERRARVADAPALETATTEALDAARTAARIAQGDHEAAHAEWVREQQEAETRREQLLQQYQDVQAQREALLHAGEDGTCPVCARPLGDHFRSVLDLLDRQTEDLTQNGRYYKSRIEQLAEPPARVRETAAAREVAQREVVALERRLAKVQAAVQDLAQLRRDITTAEDRRRVAATALAALPAGYDPARHGDIRAEIERLLPAEMQATRLSVLLDREPQLLGAREEAVAAEAAAAARLAALLAAEGPPFDAAAWDALQAEVRAAEATAHAAAVAAARAGAESDAAAAAHAAAAARLADQAAAAERLAARVTEHRLHDELDRLYGDLRTDLNAQMRPELAELASRFLAELTDGRYTELDVDDDYRVLVLEDGVPKPVISGGEEDLVHLVLRLAISQMIADRTGQPFSLLVLDEVFGSLDDTRRLSVVDLLRRLQDRFEQVVLITHIEGVRDGCDRVLQVRYDAEAGTARVSATDGGALLGVAAG